MWYILERDEEVKFVWCNDGNDPLYGNGSWGLFSPDGFNSYEEAENFYYENK